MKKKIFSFLSILVVTFAITGCGGVDKINNNLNNENKNNENNITITRTGGFHDGYAWIKSEQLDNEWAIINVNGEIIFSEKNVFPVGNIYGKHFIASDHDGSTINKNAKYYLYNIEGNLLYSTGEDGLTNITIRGTTDGNYVALLTYEKNSFEGTEKTTQYIDLSNMKSISIKETDLLDVYSNQLDGIKRPDFIEQKVNAPQLMTKAKYKCLENNGFFTIEENGKQLFEPIEGNVLALDRKNIAVLATDKNGYYIVDQTGKKEKVETSDMGTFITMYDGIITHQINSSTGAKIYEIIRADGSKITIKK